MDLQKITSLSDNQLVELYRNPHTVKEIKIEILKEINLRDLNWNNYNKDISKSKFNKIEGVCIFIFSPILISFIVFFIIFHHLILKDWNREKYKQFWKFTTLGFLFYTLLFYLFITIYK
jgi:hypothetical protein